MALLPLIHARRIRSPAEAEALFRGLRERRVALRGLRTADPAALRVVLDATRRWRSRATLAFDGGALTEAVWEALADLAPRRFAYLDVRSPAAALRLWPAHAVVHLRGPQARLEAALAEPLVVGARSRDGRALDVRALAPDASAVDVTTQDPARALALFRRAGDDRLLRSFIQDPHPSCHAALLRLLVAAGVEVSAELTLRRADARALTERLPAGAIEWQAARVTVDLATGELRGFITSPNTLPEDQRRWHARIDGALRRGGLT
ncbi:MAG: hypothetical protein R3A79_27605 [Nannocystaceae bacterium]